MSPAARTVEEDMQTAPRVSVICIFLNEERFLAEAIDSVLAQDFSDFELILVDDGSSDGSSAIARDYAARHSAIVRYVDHPGHANRGMSASRNAGAGNARGRFLAFVDADDIWRPGKLTEQLAVLDANPSIGMVCGTVIYWRSWEGGEDRILPTGGLEDALLSPPATVLKLYPLVARDGPCPSDVIIRRECHDAVGGFEEEITGAYEDQYYFSKVFLITSVWCSSHNWTYYRLHDASCMARLMGEGSYDIVRARFLEWYEAYLANRNFKGKPAVLRALRRAQWCMDHPRAVRFGRKARALARRAGLIT